MLFRTRDLLVRQRTQTINALRGHLAEFGIVAPQGRAHVARLALALDGASSSLPAAVHELGTLLLDQIAALDAKIAGLEKEIRVHARRDEEAVRADDDPGDRADLRDGDPGLRAADGELSVRPRLLGLARAGASTALDRGQAPARQDRPASTASSCWAPTPK